MIMTYNRKKSGLIFALLAGCCFSATTTDAWAWGHTGHTQMGEIAMAKLPKGADLPDFLMTDEAQTFVGELSAEPDVSKTAGRITSVTDGRISTEPNAHDFERDPGHYIDVDDNGFILGGAVKLSELPLSRRDYDTAQRSATKPAGQTQYSAGYLAYAMIDGYQQLRKDFGIYRVLEVGLKQAQDAGKKKWIAYWETQLDIRRKLILRDIGYWSHFMEDASQPMHVSVHFNGWGDYPNPKGYTTAPIHGPFEGAFVRDFIDFKDVRKSIPNYSAPKDGAPIEKRVVAYLAESLAQLEPVYEAARKDDYASASPKALKVVNQQLGMGITQLRDEIVNAWRESKDVTAGYPLLSVADVLAGKVELTPTTLASD
jgi:hypothetical protein